MNMSYFSAIVQTYLTIYSELIFIDEKASNVKVLVEVKNEEEVFLRNLTTFFCDMVNKLSFELPTLPWIDIRYKIDGETGENHAKYCTTMQSIQKNLEQLLLIERINDANNNAKKILGIFFCNVTIYKKRNWTDRF